jgi:hypothetical protein
MFVTRCGTLSKIETARIIFEEEKLADVDPIPDDAAMAGREFRYESRANEALESACWASLGPRWCRASVWQKMPATGLEPGSTSSRRHYYYHYTMRYSPG